MVHIIHKLSVHVLSNVHVYMRDSENAPEDEDDLYAAVYRLEEDNAGGEIYEDLMRTEQPPPLVLLLVTLTHTHSRAHTHTFWAEYTLELKM